MGDELWDEDGEKRVRYTGRFVDLKTLAFALTGDSYSLASAAEAFGTKHRKSEGNYAGPVTPDYINYNRQDVRVTAELLEALREEFGRHPIGVDPWQLRSPASLAKGYLRASGILPLHLRARGVPRWVIGAAMEAYFGGRTEYHVPRLVVPVVYTDFTSMYPTVQTLAKLSEWLTASSLVAVPYSEEARQILTAVSLATCLTQDLWPELRFLALVEPCDDILPLRAQYDGTSESYTIGVNRITSRTPLWYTGFDLAASVLLTGRVPRVLKAVTMQAFGRADALRPVQLRGQVELDPRSGEVFKTIVEMRQRVKRDAALPEEEKKRLGAVLKVIANSGSYGIFAEMNPQDLPDGDTREVQVVGGSQSFTADSTKPEQPGEYCFPPVAALVTGAARLLLAVLERLVMDAGGSYAMCDTDSMAIIASEFGSEGQGNRELPIRVLSWAEVGAIIATIDTLKPYGPDVRDTLLRIEDVNFWDGQQIQLWSYGISAKRYCLFRTAEDGSPEIVKASEHGLGHLLNPSDPEEHERGPSGAPKWIEAVWRGFVLRAQGQQPVPFPSWFARPAVARHGLTSPVLIRPLARQQAQLPYPDQVKPFNFGLTCYLAPGGAPEGTDPATCHLIAPYERDAREWLKQDWYDTASGAPCRVATRETTSAGVARVKSVAEIVADYAAHAESKSADLTGVPAGPETEGQLARRHVEPVYIFRLGKETNRIEEVEQGHIRTWEEVQEVYEHPRRTAWEVLYLPLLGTLPLRQLEAEVGIAESLLHRYRKGTVRPTPRQMKRIIECLKVHLGEVRPPHWRRTRPLLARQRGSLMR